MLTIERLKEVLHYEPATGGWRWLVTLSNRATAGAMAGCVSSTNGYIVIKIDGHLYRAHRLAWLYMTGEWAVEVDHKDTDRTNNRWLNLRSATRTLNNANRSASRLSCLKGAYWDDRRKKWCAKVKFEGRSYWLGYHGSEAEAHAAYIRGAAAYFGEFARAA